MYNFFHNPVNNFVGSSLLSKYYDFTYFASSMWAICKKELRQFFSSLTGYIAIIVFLLANGLVLFVFENNILDFGYATLGQVFSIGALDIIITYSCYYHAQLC